MTVKRITFLQELLGLMDLQERVHLTWISSAEAQKFVQVVTAFTEKIKSLGPNPLSAFSETPRAAVGMEAQGVRREGGDFGCVAGALSLAPNAYPS